MARDQEPYNAGASTGLRLDTSGKRFWRALGYQEQSLRIALPGVENLLILLLRPMSSACTRALQIQQSGNISGYGGADQIDCRSDRLGAALYKNLRIRAPHIVCLELFG